MTPDYFVWEAFDWASRDPMRSLGAASLQQEALLAETNSFYVIPDQFGVVSGHVLVLPKAPASSIADLDPAIDDQLTWFLQRVSDVISDAYGASTVTAEHGECNCATASQAHVHVLPLPSTITTARLREIIDDVLQRRMVGVERIVYRDTEFTALEDLQALIGTDGAAVSGRQLRCQDLTDDGPYPEVARSASGLIHPYIFFAGADIRIVTTCNVRSQFVREVVSKATGQPERSWDRRVHTSRANMFDTFARLAPAFRLSAPPMYGFTARVRPGDR
jgi:diadenosine tetraphosphate (Ap4A) HIT family hydrolase